MTQQSISLSIITLDSDTLQQDLNTLQTWERLWDMDFNPSKCQVLHISKSRHQAQYIYMLYIQALEAMNHAKYLGMDISKDLSWNTHMPNPGLPWSWIRIHSMEPFTQTYINKIEMVQRRVNSNYSTCASVSSMLDSLGWQSLEDKEEIVRVINHARNDLKCVEGLKNTISNKQTKALAREIIHDHKISVLATFLTWIKSFDRW